MIEEEKIRTAMHQAFKGKNIMTPDFIECGHIVGDYCYELTSGTGFLDSGKIWGLSLFKLDGTRDEECMQNSTMCYSLEEAESNIEYLKENLK